MAKKPVKKKSAAKKTAPPAKKKAGIKAAAKKILKKVLAPKAAVKPAKPIKAAKLVKAAKPTPAPKAAAVKPVKATKVAKAAKPIPPKLLEKQAKKEKAAKGKVKELEVTDATAVEAVEEEPVEEVYLTDAEGRRFCRVRDCDQLAAVDTYCRFHYLLHWKKIQVRKKILTEGKLERYIEELTARYPDKFLEMLRKDLRSEKEFLGAIAELEIDESAIENEMEDEAQNYIDEVRGMGEAAGERTEEDF